MLIITPRGSEEHVDHHSAESEARVLIILADRRGQGTVCREGERPRRISAAEPTPYSVGGQAGRRQEGFRSPPYGLRSLAC